MARRQPTQIIFNSVGNAGSTFPTFVLNPGDIINGTNSNDTLFGGFKDGTLLFNFLSGF